MIKVLSNYVAVYDFTRLYDIEFKFNKGSYHSKACQTLMAFDIETSNGWVQPDGEVIGFDHTKYNSDDEYKSKIDNGVPVSCLYVWQMAIESQDGPVVFLGRTWDDYTDFMCKLTNEIRRQAVYGLESVNRSLETAYAKDNKSHKEQVSCKIYIHNLGFEFQHLRNVWEEEFAGVGSRNKQGNVFARTSRKPMKCHFNLNRVSVEHRDSLCLTQKSLKSWCKDEKLPVKKLEEPKDYYLEIRTPKTQLTEEEIQYSINDVVSMIYGLEKYRDKYGTLNDIPLTQTGAVRLKCRERVSMVNPGWATKCANITRNYTAQDFRNMCQLFQGGWTHGNRKYIGVTLKASENKMVRCVDFASSYPAVMSTRTYPVGEFIKCDTNDFGKLESQDINNPKYRWYAKIKVTNLYSKTFNTYWSVSKVCTDDGYPMVSGQVVDNGRLLSCDDMTFLCTDLDWDTFKQAYRFDTMEVIELYKSESDYLPVELITTILEYFAYKTSLKGTDNESLYGESKQFINSIYGCSVMKIATDSIVFDGSGWDTIKLNDELFYDTVKRTKDEQTFLAYQQGIWVTSWARHNLWDGILHLDKKVVYCDTDSIKGVFTDDDMKWFDEYNEGIAELENKVAQRLGFDPEMYTPKTSTGKIKRLGIYERESDCTEFRTLGAKRYCDLVDGEIQCTIAGLPKSAGVNKIKSVDEFTDKMKWNTKESEKLIAKYNDDQPKAVWTDRDNNKYVCYDKYGICLQPTTFDLSLSEEFANFLKFISSGEFDEDITTDTPGYLL